MVSLRELGGEGSVQIWRQAVLAKGSARDRFIKNACDLGKGGHLLDAPLHARKGKRRLVDNLQEEPRVGDVGRVDLMRELPQSGNDSVRRVSESAIKEGNGR